MIREVHPGSGSRYFPHPGSQGQKGTRSRIRNTVNNAHIDFQTRTVDLRAEEHVEEYLI
jgi:hypothetical protein